MTEKFKSMLMECYSPYAVEQIDYEKFAKMILQECFDVLSDGKSYNHCVRTTFDQGLAACVTEKSIEAICERFGVKRIYGVNSERIVG